MPPSDDPGRWLINLEKLPSAVPMVQAALYQYQEGNDSCFKGDLIADDYAYACIQVLLRIGS